MIKSVLTNEVVLADESNYTKGRNGNNVCKITPHHMSGVLTGKQCAKIFQNANRNASANYCIGVNGDIVLSVPEEHRAWTSSSRSNDYKAITIEVSNSVAGGNWPISNASWNSLVNLCVDICKRYNFRLNYTYDASGSLTRHNMFANTDCPGQYLQGRFQELADTVNAIIDGQEPPAPAPKPEPTEGIIATIQSTLNSRYGLNIAVDNIYGKQTKKALVVGLQTELNNQYNKGLKVDGIFGNKTKNACINIKRGARGNISWLIQAMLYCQGFNPKGLDGIFGYGTEASVVQFQGLHGLSTDGIVGKETFEKMFC